MTAKPVEQAMIEFAQVAAARHIQPQRGDKGIRAGESGIGAARVSCVDCPPSTEIRTVR